MLSPDIIDMARRILRTRNRDIPLPSGARGWSAYERRIAERDHDIVAVAVGLAQRLLKGKP